MATDVRVELLVRRPRADVARFMFDPRNDAVWTTGIVACRPLTDGPLRRGTRVERTARFLGKQFDYEYEVTDADADRFVDMRVEQPFPMQIRYELADAPDGTLVAIHARGEARGFYRIASPLLNRMVRRSIRKDLELLRTKLAG
jgi:hypothetical protein